MPPQVAAPQSTSSISPQRRSNGNEVASPVATSLQTANNVYQSLISPQNSSYAINGYANIAAKVPASAPVHGHRLRDRVSTPSISTQMRGAFTARTSGFGILPTPDPTIASTISDEDVALQLMRLGDPANMSHGRTSASTMDDAFSGRADCASSVTSDGEEESDTNQGKLGLEPTGDGSAITMSRKRTASGAPSEISGDEEYSKGVYQAKRLKTAHPKPSSNLNRGTLPSKHGSKTSKARISTNHKKAKMHLGVMASNVPISPASLPAHSRKGSSASVMGPPSLPFTDEQDLSTKPRCQRCRKSKKGCDRQRPCQRCKDAGIGIDGCVSEDEGNGRKGRFGRHMGVPLQQETTASMTELSGPDGVDTHEDLTNDGDKNKKRKR